MTGDSYDAEKEAHAALTSEFKNLNGQLLPRVLMATSNYSEICLSSAAQVEQALSPIFPVLVTATVPERHSRRSTVSTTTQ